MRMQEPFISHEIMEVCIFQREAYLYVEKIQDCVGSNLNFLFESVCSTYDLFERVFLRIHSFVFV